MIPDIEHLYALRHDEDRFEAERNRIISTYIKSLPEERRHAAYAMQCRVDLARMTMTQGDLLKWMIAEAAELQANLSDQFGFIGHKAGDIKKALGAESRE